MGVRSGYAWNGQKGRYPLLAYLVVKEQTGIKIKPKPSGAPGGELLLSLYR